MTNIFIYFMFQLFLLIYHFSVGLGSRYCVLCVHIIFLCCYQILYLKFIFILKIVKQIKSDASLSIRSCIYIFIFSYTRVGPSFWALISLINSSSRMFKNVLSHAMPSKQSARLYVPLVARQSLTHSLQKKF